MILFIRINQAGLVFPRPPVPSLLIEKRLFETALTLEFISERLRHFKYFFKYIFKPNFEICQRRKLNLTF